MHKNFLSIKQLTEKDIVTLLRSAKKFQEEGMRPILQDKWVANLFFEPSTRTRCSFEMAAKQLGAQVLNLDISHSSAQKGEDLLDTVKTLEAMGCHFIVMRHSQEGVIQFLADHLSMTKVVNAGDGKNEHPSQAILDILTISQYKSDFNEISVAIVGDVRHSRVARSDIFALQVLGVKDIRVIAPSMLLPEDSKVLNVKTFENLEQGLKDVDVMIVLRVQKERMQEHPDKFNLESFSQSYCITENMLKYAKSDVIVMHPGPLNRGIEITSSVADGPHSVILQQVANGVLARMAIFEFLI